MDVKTLGFFLAAFFFLATPTHVLADSEFSDPEYRATYTVKYRGVSGGMLHVTLRSEEPGRLVYESRPEPGMFARALIGPGAVERSEMVMEGNAVRPLAWSSDDGRGGKDNGRLDFDWEAGTVHGTMKGEEVELPAKDGLQDRLSLQVAVLIALQRGEEPGTIAMVDGNEVKSYSYTRVGSRRLSTFAGTFDTVLYESTRPGSRRLSRIWHAPELGYVPVRVERLREGRVESVMEVLKVRRNAD